MGHVRWCGREQTVVSTRREGPGSLVPVKEDFDPTDVDFDSSRWSDDDKDFLGSHQ